MTPAPVFADVPSGWEVTCVGEVAQIDPENLPGSTDPYFQFSYIALEDVDKGKLLGYTEQVFFSAPSRARRILRNGDVLFATVRPNLQSHLLYVGQVPDAVCSTGFAVLRADPKKLVPQFLFHCIFSDALSKQIERLLTGSNYPALSSRDVRQLELVLPPIREQNAIVSTLATLDDVLHELQKAIYKKRAMKWQSPVERI
jgi:type I restriction enzyme, S subunit